MHERPPIRGKSLSRDTFEKDVALTLMMSLYLFNIHWATGADIIEAFDDQEFKCIQVEGTCR